MAEYIEREAVLKICSIADYAYNIADEVAKLPSADVKPVVHGHWIKNEGRHGWHCSVCGEDDLYAFAWDCDKGKNELQDRYCPNCGALMRSNDPNALNALDNTTNALEDDDEHTD